jgi:hypothetical protein
MPWISPPSRFLGAKGATRPRPVPGEFQLVSAGARRRDREFLRDPGPPVYIAPYRSRWCREPAPRRGSGDRRRLLACLLVEQKAQAALRLAHTASVLVRGQVVMSAPAAEVLASREMAEVFLGGRGRRQK